jgi:flagellar biogenesis protein FliO
MSKKFVLHKTAAHDTYDKSAPGSSLPIHRWRQLRLQLRRWWERLRRLRRRAPRRLRLCESLPLGERRFVAVVEFERSRFLVGGTTSSLVLLAHLENSQSIDDGRHENGWDENSKKNEKKLKQAKDETAPLNQSATEVPGGLQP